MSHCPYCGAEIDEGTVLCPNCGASLAREDAEWREFQIQDEIGKTKDRANMYIILATVLVTVGMIGVGVLFVSSSLLGLFGIAFVCLGIACTVAADRHEHKASNLRGQLSR
jgi:predicted nucleic acid-binding Zn ribbon protein